MKITKRFYKKALLVLMVTAMTACSSQASRMAHCEAQGISRNTCYLAEQQRQAAIVGAAEGQALQNAARMQTGGAHSIQHAQAAHKPTQYETAMHMQTIKAPVKAHTWKGYGVTVTMDRLGIVSVDGKPAAVIEKEPKATVYQAGLNNVIIYTNGKVALMGETGFIGYLK